MRILRILLFSVALTSVPARTGQSTPTAILMKVDGMINPASADFIHTTLKDAAESGAVCVIIELNTPGGLLKSTRLIVSDILASPIPVVVYVAPGGAQAASAGVFVTLSAAIAAMAPGTNIGAAHPVGLGEGQQDTIMMQKATNDAAAFVRTIAEKRHRNVRWAEEAVRKSLSITETEALKSHVIDLIAKDTRDLLTQIDGRSVETGTGTTILKTADAKFETVEMGFKLHILDLLSDPNIAYLLLMIGFYGILFELYNPGAIFPGVLGVISLLLAFYALHTLPVNYAGLALIIFGIVLFILELKITSHGILTVGGVLSLLLGSLMLINIQTPMEVVSISLSVIIPVVLFTAAFFAFAFGMAIRAHRKRPTTGIEGMIGERGVALSRLDPDGQVRVRGEIWTAKSSGEAIDAGSEVEVTGVFHLRLRVQRVSSSLT
ncbi:MAG: serine protease [Ignavibacteriales bacterium CG07_land_8_20_14_0_80_59_12]|nr:MAG: serine protease [Ignavibacteriales bacterium CG07_land_8_20_14_0_80_59_12]